MKFRTEIEPLRMAGFITHDNPVVMLGSCFSDEISSKLRLDGFDVMSNPFGPIYSSAAMKYFMEKINDDKLSDDIFFHNGLWHSFIAHTKLSFSEREQLEDELLKRKKYLLQYLKSAQAVILTFGSARSYFYNEIPVVNCHKLPANNFKNQLSSPENISCDLAKISDLIYRLNPGCKIILTISPIRHGGFGLHGNQVSKASLILGVEYFKELNPNCVYFPSYELVVDDLRDYRFYADDLKHPSASAVNYIYEKFSESFFNERTKTICKEFYSFALMLRHRIIGNDIEAVKAHESMILKEAELLYSKFPELPKPDINTLKRNLCIL